MMRLTWNSFKNAALILLLCASGGTAYTTGLKSVAYKGLRVQIPPSALLPNLYYLLACLTQLAEVTG